VSKTVAFVTVGCGRADVDSDELAGRLIGDGWQVGTDTDRADVVIVNTCGFIAAAKQDSIDAVLSVAGDGRPVVAVGCLAERYGHELAQALPEAAAVLGFDDYPSISARLADVLAGRPVSAAQPVDRRRLLPVTPVERGPAPWLPRHRLSGGPVAPLRLASGCDRRCSFCAIPSFRGRFVSRPPDQILAEAEWLAGQGVRELVLVSENSTSYGKDLGDLAALERLLVRLAATPGIHRIRVVYLQPAEVRRSLLEVIAGTPGVAPYFDLSFQHASGAVLRRMRRFGDRARFLELVATVRELVPAAGIRSNVIVGFPGETRADVVELERFLTDARLDAVGVFAYSDEDGTEAATLSGKVRAETVRRRYQRISGLVDELIAQRAEERVGETVELLVESVAGDRAEGRAAHQAPDVDGSTRLLRAAGVQVGDLVPAVVTGSVGADLLAAVR
jgi:ribosomal protein S12 methylthiotransferase RimO